MTPCSGLVVAGRFELIRELGRGGMGRVWLARHRQLDAECAVKFIEPQSATLYDELVERFEREAKAAAHIRSQHVVQIFDYGMWEGTPYMAMEYLQGEDLEFRLRRCGRLDVTQTLAIARQVGHALTRAHAAGIVHRDLKPENIFLVDEEGGELVKVLDFGIAKIGNPIAGSRRNHTGALLGTPAYMSPEQVRGLAQLDGRADLWSLAVIVYECLVGRQPFGGETLPDIFAQLLDRPLPVPSQQAPDLPLAFDDFWVRAVARERTERFATAKEFVDALAAALGTSESARRLVTVEPVEPTLNADVFEPTAGSALPPFTPNGAGTANITLATAELPASASTRRSASNLDADSPRRRGLRLLAGITAGLCIAFLGTTAATSRHPGLVAERGQTTGLASEAASRIERALLGVSESPPAQRPADPVASTAPPSAVAPELSVAAPTHEALAPVPTIGRRTKKAAPRAPAVQSAPSNSVTEAGPGSVRRPAHSTVEDPLRSGADLGI